MTRSDEDRKVIPDDDPLMTVDPEESFDPEMHSSRTANASKKVDETPVDETLDAASQRETPPIVAATIDEIAAATLGEEEQSKITEVCEKFERAWQQDDQEPSIEQYAAEDLEPGLRQLLVRHLILLDIEHRKKRDKILAPTEYLSRLPDCRNAVESALSASKSSLPRGYGSLTVATGQSKTLGHPKPEHADDATSRYRPTKMHARGGLGAVYSAVDEELNRTVALKEILPEHSSNPLFQEKFVFEAEVTGSLEHPGIVPVYGLGRYQDNQPYYAMRFIRGRSFRSAILEFHKRNPTPSAGTYLSREFRGMLRGLIEACNAIHYAHEHGVLHRDIKPDNIMLGDYGETLVVDWGLAKLIDGVSAGESTSGTGSQIRVRGSRSGNTSLGSAVGTPVYMSPEQAYGHHDKLDGKTDIYSLGAVLFNIVSGEYSIGGKSTREIVLNVREGKTRSLTSLVPSAPRALESICRKAMELEAADRYVTAVELADDIERWMSDDVVQAHIGHETIYERTGRLIRRYRGWTVSAAMALLAITVVAIVSALLINNAKQKEEIAKLAARDFKKDAVARYRDSRDAIDTWLVQSSDALEFFPGTQAVRQRLLQLATEDYEQLSKRASQDPELELERGRALVKLADLHQIQHEYETAVSHYSAALKLFEADVDDTKLAPQFRAEHGNAHTKLGIAFADQENTSAAASEFATAIAELSQLASEHNDPLSRRLLAVAYVNAGELSARSENVEVAIQHLQEALRQYALLAPPTDGNRELAMARTRELLGRIYGRQGQHEMALSEFQDAVTGLAPLVAAEPDHPNYLDALASVYISQASDFRERGLVRQQAAALQSSVGYYRALRKAFPDVPRYEENLAITLTDLGLTLHEIDSNGEAEPILIEGHDLLADLVDSYGKVPRFREDLAACQDVLGQVFMDIREDPAEASQLFVRSVTSYQLLAQMSQARPDYIERLAVAQSHYAQSLQRQHKSGQADFEAAISTLQQLIEIEASVPRYANALAHVHYRYGLMLHDQKDEHADEQFAKARDIWMGMEARTAGYTHDLAWLLATCPVSSIYDPEASLRYAAEAVRLAPENPIYLTTQAMGSLLAGQHAHALTLLDQSKSLRGHWTGRDLFVLAMAQQRRGDTGQARKSIAEGALWVDQNQPYNADTRLLREIAESALADEAN